MWSARSCSRRGAGLLTLSLAGGCAPPCDDAGVVCTVAGIPGTQGFNGDGLPAGETSLYFPSSLAWSQAGTLLVDDFNNNTSSLYTIAQTTDAVATFEDLGGKTRVTLRMVFVTREEHDNAKGFGAVELGLQTLGKLARHVGAE